MPSQSQQTPKKLFYSLIFGALLAAGLSYFIPVVGSVDDPTATHWRMVFTMVLATLITSSAVWFMVSLRQFKVSLRKAYILLGVGLICFSLAMLQVAVIALLDEWNSAWATGGGLLLIFVLGTFFMHLSMRQLARTLEMKGILTSLWAVGGISIVVAVISWAVSTQLLQYNLDGIAIYEGAMGWAGAYAACAALLAHQIKKVIGPRYNNAIRWQTWAFVAFTLGAIHEIVTTWYLTTGDWYEDYGVYLWGFIGAAVLFLRASYEFRLLTAREDNAGTATVTTDRDYIDSLIAVANLASNPRAIDPIMDDMRVITSSLPKDGLLSGSQKSQLVTVYRKLEDYLMCQDPLRTYAQNEVREQVKPGFMLVLKTGVIPATPAPEARPEQAPNAAAAPKAPEPPAAPRNPEE